MKKSNLIAIAVAGALGVLPVASALADSKLVGSLRIGFQYLDNDDNDGETTLRNYGSRLIWTGSNNITDSLEGIARVEIGINPDSTTRGASGIDRTRQVWAGVKSDFGTIKWGAQYAAFYDMVQGNTDIAWWGSCFQQFECSREPRVLKYSGGAGDLSYSASIEASPEETDEEEIFDEIEFGVNYALGSWTVGLAAAIHLDNTVLVPDLDADGDPILDADGNVVEVDSEDEGGALVGALVKGDIGPASVAVTLQSADEDFADGDDTVTHLTVAGTIGNFYGLFNQADDGDTNPYFGTLGYTLNLGDNALMYYEIQAQDEDAGADTVITGRATFKYDF